MRIFSCAAALVAVAQYVSVVIQPQVWNSALPILPLRNCHFLCAGASGRFLEQDVELFERDMQLNYFGTLYVLKAVLPGMTKRRCGHVVMLTSVAATIGTSKFLS